ncbi:MAG: hypothetical protein CL609_03525 [Anaerolineaceae bacterium]|nr:hypothetical protein [Anaerolineaceae bacterium]
MDSMFSPVFQKVQPNDLYYWQWEQEKFGTRKVLKNVMCTQYSTQRLVYVWLVVVFVLDLYTEE